MKSSQNSTQEFCISISHIFEKSYLSTMCKRFLLCLFLALRDSLNQHSLKIFQNFLRKYSHNSFLGFLLWISNWNLLCFWSNFHFFSNKQRKPWLLTLKFPPIIYLQPIYDPFPRSSAFCFVIFCLFKIFYIFSQCGSIFYSD